VQQGFDLWPWMGVLEMGADEDSRLEMGNEEDRIELQWQIMQLQQH
jgi:hypothetical protein